MHTKAGLPAEMTDVELVNAIEHLYQERAIAEMAVKVSIEDYLAIVAARDKQWASMLGEPVGYEHHEHRPFGAPGEIKIQAVLASQYVLPDGTISSDFQWLIDSYRANKNTIKLIPLCSNEHIEDSIKTRQAAFAAPSEQDDLRIAYMAGYLAATSKTELGQGTKRTLEALIRSECPRSIDPYWASDVDRVDLKETP